MKPESPDLLRLREINETLYEVIKISRDTIIEQLINSTFDHIQQNPETLDSYLRCGFEGFENYSDQELIDEYREYISEDPSADIEIILQED